MLRMAALLVMVIVVVGALIGYVVYQSSQESIDRWAGEAVMAGIVGLIAFGDKIIAVFRRAFGKDITSKEE